MHTEPSSPPLTDNGPVLLLALIHLQDADLAMFESYERIALPLARSHGAEVSLVVRTLDGLLEVHVLRFPSREVLAGFLQANARRAAQDLLVRSGARVEVHEIRAVSYT